MRSNFHIEKQRDVKCEVVLSLKSESISSNLTSLRLHVSRWLQGTSSYADRKTRCSYAFPFLTGQCRFQRDSRNALFSNYDAQTRARPQSGSPALGSSRNAPFARSSSPYGAHNDSSPQLSAYAPSGGAAFSAYSAGGGGEGSSDGTFRSATPNRRGQYSDAVLNELESQNDDQAGEMSKKVKMLKEVSAGGGLLRSVQR